MGSPARVQVQQSLNGKNFSEQQTLTVERSFIVESTPAIPAAKNGSMVFASTSTGTLTMAAGHGLTTACHFDLYWAGGARFGVLAGTVATNSVPFSGGAGDNVPTGTTVITAMIPVVETIDLITGLGGGAPLAAIFAFLAAPGHIEFTDGTHSLHLYFPVAADAWSWYNTKATSLRNVNPFDNVSAGFAPTSIKVTHSDSTKANLYRVGVGF